MISGTFLILYFTLQDSLPKSGAAKEAKFNPFKASFNKWEATNLGNDKATEKFRRLMGIKNTSNLTNVSETDTKTIESNSSKWFNDQEKQFEKAR